MRVKEALVRNDLKALTTTSKTEARLYVLAMEVIARNPKPCPERQLAVLYLTVSGHKENEIVDM